MSIVIENITIDDREFTKTYSNANMMIEQDGTGALYSEAIDPEGIGRTYTETDIPIERDDADAEEILGIILGGEA